METLIVLAGSALVSLGLNELLHGENDSAEREYQEVKKFFDER